MKKLIILIILLLSIPAMATVSTGESIRQYFSPGAATTTFTFTQPCNSSSDILVFKQLESSGLQTLLVEDTDYTIAPTGGDYLNGGVVTISPALGTTYQVIVVREIRKSQGTAQGAITPTSIVDALDKLTRTVQDLEDRNDRSWHLQESDAASFDMEIPGLDDRAGTFPFFNDLGVLTYVADLVTNSETASAFGLSIMQSASAAAARVLLVLDTTDAVEFAGITGTTGTFSGAITTDGITIGSNEFVVTDDGSGDTTIAGTLDVTGDSTLVLASASTATTQAASDDDTSIATTAHVKDYVPPAAVIKGWVRFDGTGVPAIDDSYNVSGTITDDGTGKYTITWDTDFADTNYCIVGTANGDTGVPKTVIISGIAAGTTSIYVLDVDGANIDATIICVMVMGTQ